MTTTPLITPLAVATLRMQVSGLVHERADDGYAAACAGFNLTHQQRPALVVEATSVHDVVAAVRFARRHGLGIGVQATGHGLARTTDERALLIVTRGLDTVDVDPVTRTAWVGAGVRWAPVLAAAQKHGLAPLLGSSPTVGAVGYTLGGGMGWLARKHGLSCDRVRRFELVTADGSVVEASAESNRDIFFALRGAGAGNLGVVTGMEIDLVEVTTVHAGNLHYPASMAHEVLARWRDWLPTVPDELTSAVALMNYPPLPEVPEPLRGRSFAILRGCHVGDPAEAASLLAHWRDWCAPELDSFGPMPFSDVATISNDPVDPMPGMSTGAWLDDLDATAIDALVAGTFPTHGPPTIVVTELRHAGGAIARPVTDTVAAFGNRDALVSLQMVGVTPTPDARDGFADHTAAVMEALGACRSGATYLNWLEGEEKRRAARTALGDRTSRLLAAIKAAVDPDDVFDRGLDLTTTPA